MNLESYVCSDNPLMSSNLKELTHLCGIFWIVSNITHHEKRLFKPLNICAAFPAVASQFFHLETRIFFQISTPFVVFFVPFV